MIKGHSSFKIPLQIDYMLWEFNVLLIEFPYVCVLQHMIALVPLPYHILLNLGLIYSCTLPFQLLWILLKLFELIVWCIRVLTNFNTTLNTIQVVLINRRKKWSQLSGKFA